MTLGQEARTPQPPSVDVSTVVRQSARPARGPLHVIGMVLRIAVPIALLSYMFTLVSLRDLGAAITSVSAEALAGVAAALVVVYTIATLRWRLTLRACGVQGPIPLLHLFRLTLIGAFYNAFVPGGLGGDVVRAVATRPLLGDKGMPGALSVVFLDRVFGFIGLVLLVVGSFTFFPLPGVPHVMLLSAAGLGVAFAAIAGLMLAPTLAPHVPGAIGRLLGGVPRIASRTRLVGGMALSVMTQSCSALIGHLVLSSITDEVSLMESAVIMPLVLASQYFPLTVGGTGVREAAFVALYGLVGVAQHDALAAALVVGIVHYAGASPGGVVQMLWPLRVQLPESGQDLV
jgi:uncharacterized membrane protein YbhN (UPF0104 family)